MENALYLIPVTLGDTPVDKVKVRRTGWATLHTDTELHNLLVK